jgi:isopenicillin N synthase-like dioxygenase
MQYFSHLAVVIHVSMRNAAGRELVRSLNRKTQTFTTRRLSTSVHLPVIDISCLTRVGGSPEDKEELGRQIKAACTDHGFFYVAGHGVSTEAQNEAFSASASFFDMPNEDKRAIPFSSGGFTRGYIGMGEESGSDRLEVKEAFSYGYEWREDNKERGTEGNPMQGPNRWPSPISFPSSHRESLNGYYKEACRVSHAVTKGLALALGEKEEFLDKFCENGDSISLMRLFKYYPYSHGDAVAASLSPGDEMKERERTGSSPHTDWGFLTLIMQQGDVTGLELWHKEAWHPVPPIPGTLLVNIGDYISLLTKGSFKSPVIVWRVTMYLLCIYCVFTMYLLYRISNRALFCSCIELQLAKRRGLLSHFFTTLHMNPVYHRLRSLTIHQSYTPTKPLEKR